MSNKLTIVVIASLAAGAVATSHGAGTRTISGSQPPVAVPVWDYFQYSHDPNGALELLIAEGSGIVHALAATEGMELFDGPPVTGQRIMATSNLPASGFYLIDVAYENGLYVKLQDAVQLTVYFKSLADCGGTDINNDGAVDAGDLALLLGNWGACE